MCAVFLVGCGASGQGDRKAASAETSADESQRLPEMFAKMVARVAGASATGDTVRLGEHTLSLSTKVEQVATGPDGGVAAGVKVTCRVDGVLVEALTSGSVGIDASREAALATAAAEWAMQYGTPIVDALSAKAPELVSAGYKVYAGPVGIRGDKPDGLEDVNAGFFRAIEPTFAKLFSPPGGLHAIDVLVVRNDGNLQVINLRVDGQDSDALKALATQVKWPTGASYMLKQYYVLRED